MEAQKSIIVSVDNYFIQFNIFVRNRNLSNVKNFLEIFKQKNKIKILKNYQDI